MNEDIKARLQTLEDHAAIGQLIASYGPLADSGNAEALAELWTEDGVYSVGGHGVAQGRTAIAGLIRSPTHRELMHTGCAHVLTDPVVELSGDAAVARNYSIVFRNQGDAFMPWRVSANRWQMIRTSAGWLVQRRENAPLNGEDAARALLRR